MTFGASWGARLVHLSHCFKCPCVDFQSLTCFEAQALSLSVLKVKRILCFCCYICFQCHSPHSCSLQAATAKVTALRRTTVNKQTKPHPRKVFLRSPLQIFSLGWWQHWAWSQVREEPPFTERSRWPGRPRQRGALEGWKGSGAERERHICCTAGRSVWNSHCGPLESWRWERERGL